MNAPNERYHLPLLAALAMFLFSLNLDGYDLWPADEPRYAQVAREMLQSGDWLSPTVNGESYLEKPPLLFWSQAALSLPFGDVNEWTARVPSVLSAVVTVLLTYLLARALFGSGVAFWSALLLITCQRFWWQARTGQIDMLLTAFMMLSLYALWRWHESRRTSWLALVYAGMAAGMLAKGPPALIFPLLFIWSYYWRDPESRRQTHWLLGSLAAMLVTLAWFIPARLLAGGDVEEAVETGIAGNLFRNTIGRLVLGVSKAQWPWYYLETIPADLLPWTLLLPWALYWLWRNRNESAMHRVLWCWCVPALIFFSISVGKRSVYILPLFPVFAIILAASMSSFSESSLGKRRVVLGIWVALLVVLGVAGITGGVLYQDSGHLIPMTLFGVACIGAGIALALRERRADSPSVVGAMATAMIGIYALAPFFVFPLVNDFKGASNFCEPIRVAAQQGDIRLYSVGFSREEFIYYANHHHEPVLMDLVGRDHIPADDLMAAAEFQRKLKNELSDAVDEVPVADWSSVTDQEIAALHAAARATLSDEEIDPVRLADFERSLHEEVGVYWQQFTAPGKTFAMAQEQDWKWLLALEPDLRAAKLVHAENVGRREMLLFTYGQ